MTTLTPAAAVQPAVFKALKDGAAVAAVFASLDAPVQVFDYAPRDVTGKVTKSYPFLAFGPAQIVPAGAANDCDGEVEAFQDVEVWDDAVKRGAMGAKRLGDAVAADAGRILVFTGWSCSEAQVQTIRSLPEVNGVARSIVTLRYLLDPA